MPERINSNSRLLLSCEEQVKFLANVKSQLSISWFKIAKAIDVNPRTLSDWVRAKATLPIKHATSLSKISAVPLPQPAGIVDQFWYTSKAGKLGGNSTFSKYGCVGGDVENRKNKWLLWHAKNDAKNNLGKYAVRKDVVIPHYSQTLAEFVGIVLGDGGLTERQLKITLNGETDADYIAHVSTTITSLFCIPTNIQVLKQSKAINIVVSRTSLVEFLTSVGLHVGNKVIRQVDIPEWIRGNHLYEMSCVKGLVDTDGSIYMERHIIKDVKYSYLRLAFVNKSIPLLNSVYSILRDAGLSPKIRGGKAVTLENNADVIRYFECFGTNNPKHLKRFITFKEECVSGRNERS